MELFARSSSQYQGWCGGYWGAEGVGAWRVKGRGGYEGVEGMRAWRV